MFLTIHPLINYLMSREISYHYAKLIILCRTPHFINYLLKKIFDISHQDFHHFNFHSFIFLFH